MVHPDAWSLQIQMHCLPFWSGGGPAGSPPLNVVDCEGEAQRSPGLSYNHKSSWRAVIQRGFSLFLVLLSSGASRLPVSGLRGTWNQKRKHSSLLKNPDPIWKTRDLPKEKCRVETICTKLNSGITKVVRWVSLPRAGPDRLYGPIM